MQKEFEASAMILQSDKVWFTDSFAGFSMSLSGEDIRYAAICNPWNDVNDVLGCMPAREMFPQVHEEIKQHASYS